MVNNMLNHLLYSLFYSFLVNKFVSAIPANTFTTKLKFDSHK